MILAGDVGGTKTQLALFDPGSSGRAPRQQRRFASRDHASLEAIVTAFLEPLDARPTRAVFGIAGPVVDNRVEATNLPWHMSGESLSERLSGARVTLLNDLVTTAWGLGELGGDDLVQLQAGRPMDGNRALIAAGTGLGEAVMVRHDGLWIPSASEGGHADFGPRNPLEDELLQWLRARYGRVSYERVLSGPGLADLYRFCRETGRGDEPGHVAYAFDTASDAAALVTQAALDGSCERATIALTAFAGVYGAEAGNLALKTLALGGLFVGGGIAPKIRPFLTGGAFLAAFTQKGRLTPLLESIPVAMVLDEHTSLWGAARVALDSPEGTA